MYLLNNYLGLFCKVAATVFRAEYSAWFTQIYVVDKFLVMSLVYRYTFVPETNNIY